MSSTCAVHGSNVSSILIVERPDTAAVTEREEEEEEEAVAVATALAELTSSRTPWSLLE